MKHTIDLRIDSIFPHPDNPRKDLGDLTELTESIKKNGLMQNLTVMPGHWDENRIFYDDGYTILIGHRRCAAAKEAGLPSIPCRIVEDISPNEQVSMMLEENMQRNDLTIWEQSNGFQMMLDLGDNEDQIAEKTGFSKSTIRHRLNIAKLNQKELQKKENDEGYQMSLKDLYELEKIPDIKTRDRILKESTSSNNLSQKIQYELKKIKKEENFKKYEKLCNESGITKAKDGTENEIFGNKWDVVKQFYITDEVKQLGLKSLAQKEDLYYLKRFDSVYIIKKKNKEKKELTKEEIEQKVKDKKKQEIKQMQKIMAAERLDFIHLAIEKKFKPEEEKTEDILVDLFELMINSSCYIFESTLSQFITGDDYVYSKSEEEISEYKKKRDSIGLIYKMMIYIESELGDTNFLLKWDGIFNEKHGRIVKNFDRILSLYGFAYSKEEFYKIEDGSHELFQKKEKDSE